MVIQFDRFKNVFRNEILKTLESSNDQIHKLVSDETIERSGECKITGMSLDLLPWHGYAAISFRCWDDDSGIVESPADWKYSAYIEDHQFAETKELIRTSWETPLSGCTHAEIAHLIFMAAAEALLDSAIGEKLREIGIDVTVETGQVPEGRLFFVVIDDDRQISANYCELVIANKLTDRLLAK